MATKSKIEATVSRYVQLKHEADRIESEMKTLRPAIEARLQKQPDLKEEIAGYILTLVKMSRENFRLAEAKKNIDGRTLAPYLSVSEYNMLKIK